jgi:hypothetical protein
MPADSTAHQRARRRMLAAWARSVDFIRSCAIARAAGQIRWIVPSGVLHPATRWLRLSRKPSEFSKRRSASKTWTATGRHGTNAIAAGARRTVLGLGWLGDDRGRRRRATRSSTHRRLPVAHHPRAHPAAMVIAANAAKGTSRDGSRWHGRPDAARLRKFRNRSPVTWQADSCGWARAHDWFIEPSNRRTSDTRCSRRPDRRVAHYVLAQGRKHRAPAIGSRSPLPRVPVLPDVPLRRAVAAI